MQAYHLFSHPSANPKIVSGIRVSVKTKDPNWLTMRWRIEGANELVVPAISGKSRANELWKTTCFEMFVRHGDETAYTEWNFSPSRRWNAYTFTHYREGMRDHELVRPPDTVWHGGSGFALFDVAIPKAALPVAKCEVGFSAVIEEEGERISYWSLAHPDAERPDFHHTACFAASLDPRGAR